MVAENKIIPAANKVIGSKDRRSGFGGGYRPNVSGRKKDRRKAPYDRRDSVRDGVIVALSFKKDRRQNFDRRSRALYRPLPTNTFEGPGCNIIA